MSLSLPALPFHLSQAGATWRLDGGGRLLVWAPPATDIFVPPFKGERGVLNAPTLLGPAPNGNFQLAARVTVNFGATFDAGVLLVWFDERHWAKLCFEAAPDGKPTIVSVVNRTVSDDANAFAVDARSAWLRVSRVDGIYMFHASVDGERWDMVRIFDLGVAGLSPAIGFEGQSPTGPGCEVHFEEIRFTRERLADPRSGV
ncbi:DUF1349 domain-containing protein [Paenarthrobacter nicotinovorans]|uniref:DUF1349 domain-containing protein n=1 Tax=Paenarthrobacter nicotinovorans TaxID=29320 RepID=UPI003747B634